MAAILVESAGAFLACLVLHVMVWRVRRPASYRAWLPSLTFIFLVAGPALAWWAIDRRAVDFGEARPDRLTEWAAVVLLHGAAASVYIIGYTLLSAFSPSIEILKRIDQAPGGLARDAIDVPFLRTAIGGDRVKNLVADGLLEADGDAVRLGPRAQTLARIALVYRRAIGLPDGAGG